MGSILIQTTTLTLQITRLGLRILVLGVRDIIVGRNNYIGPPSLMSSPSGLFLVGFNSFAFLLHREVAQSSIM